MRSKGKISSWNDEKGYGFVSPLVGGKQVFIHIKAFGNRNRRPEVNDIVTFALSTDKQGRPCAAEATLAGDKVAKRAPRKSSAPLIAFALLFLAAVGISVIVGRLPEMVGIAYAALSLVTFTAYAIDKAAAKRDAWRTAENTLHLLGLAGGWPGALIAQQTLRHKSKKAAFRTTFSATALINCAVFLWLHYGRRPNRIGSHVAERYLRSRLLKGTVPFDEQAQPPEPQQPGRPTPGAAWPTIPPCDGSGSAGGRVLRIRRSSPLIECVQLLERIRILAHHENQCRGLCVRPRAALLPVFERARRHAQTSSEHRA
jgi:uncharacterized membrane protein YsdA (DUF1294 family)/cold shock CspA family protein